MCCTVSLAILKSTLGGVIKHKVSNAKLIFNKKKEQRNKEIKKI